MAKSNTVKLTAAPRKPRERSRQDHVIEREQVLSDMADNPDKVEVDRSTDDGGTETETITGFVIDGEKLGVRDASVPVTVGQWAKRAGRDISVLRRRVLDENGNEQVVHIVEVH